MRCELGSSRVSSLHEGRVTDEPSHDRPLIDLHVTRPNKKTSDAPSDGHGQGGHCLLGRQWRARVVFSAPARRITHRRCVDALLRMCLSGDSTALRRVAPGGVVLAYGRRETPHTHLVSLRTRSGAFSQSEGVSTGIPSHARPVQSRRVVSGCRGVDRGRELPQGPLAFDCCLVDARQY